MNPNDAPPPIPKITLPVWAYFAFSVFAVPVGVAYLTGGSVRTALATALSTAGLNVGYVAVVAKPQVQAAALAHREVNLALGYAQGAQDATPPRQPARADEQHPAPPTLTAPQPATGDAGQVTWVAVVAVLALVLVSLVIFGVIVPR